MSSSLPQNLPDRMGLIVGDEENKRERIMKCRTGMKVSAELGLKMCTMTLVIPGQPTVHWEVPVHGVLSLDVTSFTNVYARFRVLHVLVVISIVLNLFSRSVTVGWK